MKRTALAFTMATSIAMFAGHSALAQDKDMTLCAGSINNADAAVAACSRIIKGEYDGFARRTAGILSLRGWAWKLKGDAEHALADFNEAIRLDADQAPAYEGRGSLYRDNNQCAEALADYDQAIRLQPKRAENYLSRGLCRVTQNDLDKALSDLDQVAKLDANNANGLAVRALSMKALVRSQKNDIDGALADATEAIRLDPQRPSLYVARATLWTMKGAKGQTSAFADFDQAIRLDENNSRGAASAAWWSKARVRSSGGDVDAAIDDLGQAIKIAAAPGPIYLDRAALWLRKGDNEHALADYDAAIKAGPEDPQAYNTRGDFFRDQGQYDKAIADYEKAADIRPDDPTTLGSRGLTRFFQGDFAKAAQDFAKLFDLQPNSYTLLWLYASRGRADSPRQARSESTKLSTKVPGEEWPAPIVQLVLGKKSSPEAIFAEATTPEQRCEARFYVGEWQLLQKDRTEAGKALQAAVDSCPKEAAESIAAREELKRLKTASR